MHKRYIITVVPDTSGTVRKFEIDRKAIRLAIAASSAFVIFLGFLVFSFLQGKGTNNQIHALQKEIAVLKEINGKYQQTSENLEEKLNYFSEKTKRLASYVGVNVALEDENLGIGGYDYLEDNYSKYLTKDLDAMDGKAEAIFEGFKHLEKVYKEKNDLLRSVPSIWPVKGLFTDGFGSRIDPFTGKKAFHKGIDIAAKRGTPIIAPADGMVSKSGMSQGFGNMIVVNHKGNVVTRYGHLQDIFVKKGQTVKRGDIIGTLGNTGRSTGPHLHFEILEGNKNINPRSYIISEIMHF